MHFAPNPCVIGDHEQSCSAVGNLNGLCPKVAEPLKVQEDRVLTRLVKCIAKPESWLKIGTTKSLRHSRHNSQSIKALTE